MTALDRSVNDMWRLSREMGGALVEHRVGDDTVTAAVALATVDRELATALHDAADYLTDDDSEFDSVAALLAEVERLRAERDEARREAALWHGAASAAAPPGPLKPRPLPWADEDGDA